MKPPPPPRAPGFTLVEMMVSMALVCIIAVLLVTTTNSASSLWRYTTNRIEEFRGARTAFEEITGNLSQATLNTYWDYSGSQSSLKYIRQSDLRFIAGPSEAELFLAGKTSHAAPAARRPTHGVFFQSPLGMVDDSDHFSGLENLLNTWGYYIEFNKDLRPPLIEQMPNPPPSRYRYRLMELMEPSNDLTLYKYTSGNPKYAGRDWFTEPMNGFPAQAGAGTVLPTHVLAENVIALIVLPKLSKAEDPSGTTLAPQYTYDTSPISTAPAALNQLPPIVQVTLVAIDEASAARTAARPPSLTPPPSLDALLDSKKVFIDAKNFDADLAALQTGLINLNIGFRVFTSDVSIRAAKWSRK